LHGRHNFSFARLDGTLNLQQREKVIKEFSEDKSILVLLMSLKAGGVGINLTAASNAFVMVCYHQVLCAQFMNENISALKHIVVYTGAL
jgi:hypothetical protein